MPVHLSARRDPWITSLPAFDMPRRYGGISCRWNTEAKSVLEQK